jgi:hypothetical protein
MAYVAFYDLQRAITPISLLFATVLQLGTSSLDPLRDLTHGGLCDPV